MLERFLISAAIFVMIPMAAFVVPNVSEGAGPWKGQVADKETGKPLEGVVVLAVWERYFRGLGIHGAAGGYGASEEVVTDKQGHFTIEARSSWTLNPFVYLKGPEFYIFKSGYGRWQFQGQDRWSKDALESEEQRKQAWKKFEGEGVVLELPRLSSREARLRFINRPGGEIPVDKMQKYLQALDQERINLGLMPGYTK